MDALLSVACEALPSRDFLPGLLMVAAVFLAAILALDWARHEPANVRPWRWGDPRRREPDATEMLAVHLACVAAIGLAIVATIRFG